MSESTSARPTIITVLCIIGFIGAGLAILLGLGLLALVPVFGAIYLAVCGLSLAGLIMTFQMKKLGVYLYAAAQIASIGVNLAAGGELSIPTLAITGAVLAVFFTNLNKMS